MGGQVDTPFAAEAPYHVPLVLGALSDLVGPQLGLARAALELVIDNAATRGVSATVYREQTQAPTVQLAVARAASSIDTAEALVFSGGRSKWIVPAARSSGRRCWTASGYGCNWRAASSRRAMRSANWCRSRGVRRSAESNPLQRIWRDSEIASRHAVANPEISAEAYGRVLLGITEPVIPL